MKRTLTVALALTLLLAGTAWGEDKTFEFGAGVFPKSGGARGDAEKLELGYAFHAAWTPLIFIASVDSFAIPPGMVEEMTSSYDTDGKYIAGWYRPGFVNTLGGGLQLNLWAISLGAQVGVNNLYVYRQTEDKLDIDASLGVHIKLGVGFIVDDWIKLQAYLVSIQPTFADVAQIAKGIFDAKTQKFAVDKFMASMVPAIMLVVRI